MARKIVLFSLQSVSSYSSRKEWENVCWRKMIKSKNLDLLITSYERHNLVMRAAVTDMVRSGKRYKQIAEELLLSPQTIYSIKESLNGNNYRSYRERGKTERKRRVYSAGVSLNKHNSGGRRVRTKYGVINLP